MRLRNRVVVITGGAAGIGLAMGRRFAAEGARVALCDLDAEAVARSAADVGALGGRLDVADAAGLETFLARVRAELGPVDVFCANAGIAFEGDPWTSDADWQRIWEVNVRSHIYAARAVLPEMLERQEGYLVHTASAAGLLTQLGSAPYAVTKHAVIALAEWLAITYGDRGIRVSVLAPQAVNTAMAAGMADSLFAAAGVDGMLEPDAVAAAVIDAIEEERFLILPHPEVATYFQRKAADYDRWLAGMRRLQASLLGDLPPVS